MRRAKLTFPGTFHHCLNLGHGRKRIDARCYEVVPDYGIIKSGKLLPALTHAV
jgi:hypothetical protein